MEIITPAELASYLRDESLATDPGLIQIVGLVDDLISENWGWAEPATPMPAKIRLLALNVAARAWAWNPAAAHLESITRSIDDGSRTERYRSGGGTGSVYLTDEELLMLRGKSSVRSIRLVNYGDK